MGVSNLNFTFEYITTITWTDIVVAIAATLTLLILCCAFFLARREISCIDKTREAEILTDLSKQWNEEQLTESRKVARNYYKDSAKLKIAIQKARDENEQEYYSLVRILDFFEALGVLVNSTCLNKQLTKDLFGTAIVYYHDLYQPSIKYLRDIHGDENIYKWFDYLVKEIAELNKES